MPRNYQLRIGKIDKKKLILVEGADGLYFLISLINSKNIKDIKIIDFGGIDELTKCIEAIKLIEGFDEVISLIIFRDSEKSKDSASLKINHSLKSTGIITKDIRPFIIDKQNNRKIGFGLFPGIGENGTLEDLCLRLFKEGTNNELIKTYLTDFQTKKGNFTHLHKNELHALFSFTDKYVGYKIGEAASFGGFDFDSPYLEPFFKLIYGM